MANVKICLYHCAVAASGGTIRKRYGRGASAPPLQWKGNRRFVTGMFCVCGGLNRRSWSFKNRSMLKEMFNMGIISTRVRRSFLYAAYPQVLVSEGGYLRVAGAMFSILFFYYYYFPAHNRKGVAVKKPCFP